MFISLRITKRTLAAAAVSLLILAVGIPALALSRKSAQAMAPAGPNDERPKTVYLTFDDGPSKNTDGLLDMLAAQDVKVTFFVTGQDPDAFDCIARADADGHLIALHTYSHDFADIYASDEAFWADIAELDALIFEQTGKHSAYLRFPGGSSNTVSKRYGGSGLMKTLAEQCEQRGIVYVDWNIDTKDAEGGVKSVDYIVERALNGAKDVSGDLVILMHDGTANKNVAEAAEALIERFRAEGYVFDTLDHMTDPPHHRLN